MCDAKWTTLDVAAKTTTEKVRKLRKKRRVATRRIYAKGNLRRKGTGLVSIGD